MISRILKRRSIRPFYGSTKDFAEPGFDLSGLPQIAIYPFSSDQSWISKINTEKDRSLDWAFGLGQVAQHIRSHMWRRHLHTRHLGGAHSEFSSPCDFTRSTSVLSVKPGLLSFSVFDLGHPWSIGRKRVDSKLGKSWSVKSWFCPIFSRTVKSATWSLL